ncbi:hypothetical protein [Mesorhizobium sp. M0859]|uniref:hypothetical protein n=1 Tax=Mesorhizobium sp. M0859 TaxID=2957014 RepID=UPI00333B2076
MPDRVTVPVTNWTDDTVTVDLEEQWVCGDHWREVGSRRRRLLSAARRKVKRVRTMRAMLVFVRVWQGCTREAIEKAVGI